MKALALTILTFFACLIVLDLFTGYHFNPSQAAPPPAERKAALPVITVTSPAELAATSIPTVVAAAAIVKSEPQNVPVSSGMVAAPLAEVAGAAPIQVSVASVSGADVAANAAVPADVAVVEATPTAVAVADLPAVASAPADAVANQDVTTDSAAPAVQSPTAAPLSPQLQTFAENMKNGQANQVVGVFVQDLFALPVVQQPDGQTNFVSTDNNTVTQFDSASAYGAIGLLAHNFLSGKLFFNLKPGQDVFVVYGDGRVEDYRINQLQRYQALDPSNPYSYFLDASDPSAKAMTAGALFNRVYAHPDQVVLQTCIEANGDSSWGRLFVTASKVQ